MGCKENAPTPALAKEASRKARIFMVDYLAFDEKRDPES
jgi:hypothetical protein